MNPDFDPRFQRNTDDFETVRPTENSAWFVLYVLLVGVALAGWYVLGDFGASRFMGLADNSISQKTMHPSEPLRDRTP